MFLPRFSSASSSCGSVIHGRTEGFTNSARILEASAQARGLQKRAHQMQKQNKRFWRNFRSVSRFLKPFKTFLLTRP